MNPGRTELRLRSARRDPTGASQDAFRDGKVGSDRAEILCLTRDRVRRYVTAYQLGPLNACRASHGTRVDWNDRSKSCELPDNCAPLHDQIGCMAQSSRFVDGTELKVALRQCPAVVPRNDAPLANPSSARFDRHRPGRSDGVRTKPCANHVCRPDLCKFSRQCFCSQ